MVRQRISTWQVNHLIRINLGKVGTGNQVFIFAGAYSIASQGRKVLLITSVTKGSFLEQYKDANRFLKIQPLRKFSYFNLFLYLKSRFPKHREAYLRIFGVKESDEIIPQNPNLNPRTKIIEGYFQDLNWFIEGKTKIKEMFSALPESEALGQLSEKKQGLSIGIHVRRGDYMNLKTTFGILDIEYYKACLNSIRSTNISRTLVFSDDINWCKENFNFLINPQFIGEEQLPSPIENMKLMGLCDILICANSSFSISAAAIYGNPTVFVPSKIYIDYDIQETLTGSYPENWEKVTPVWSP